MEALDPDKDILLQSDIKELKNLKRRSMMKCMVQIFNSSMQLTKFI